MKTLKRIIITALIVATVTIVTLLTTSFAPKIGECMTETLNANEGITEAACATPEQDGWTLRPGYKAGA